MACGEKQSPPVLEKSSEIQFIQPKKPVTIKVKRYVKGGYAWEINGSDVEDILEADKRLKEVLGRTEK